MPKVLPYLPSNKNLEILFNKIAAAKVPDTFTHEFLNNTIGLKGTADRALIPLLRTLGYLDGGNAPTSLYGELKNPKTAKTSVAAAIQRAYAPLFDANENTHKLAVDDLKGLVAQVAGTDEDMTARVVQTFNALSRIADFDTPSNKYDKPKEKKNDPAPDVDEKDGPQRTKGLRPEFHYNIQIHLPSNGTEEIYLSIFNAMRKVFQ